MYIGCHYVDLVHFVTGLLPSAVSVYGVLDELPNGKQGYLWTDARVLWENGACLNVQNSLSFPDAAPGPNTQGMTLYCTGGGRGALIDHSDQYRGIAYSFGQPGTEFGRHPVLGTEPGLLSLPGPRRSGTRADRIRSEIRAVT